MKTLFAALASALVVSTAFAQTAAPSAAQPAQTQAAGQANLKASTAVQTGAADNGTATTKAPAKAGDALDATPSHGQIAAESLEILLS